MGQGREGRLTPSTPWQRKGRRGWARQGPHPHGHPRGEGEYTDASLRGLPHGVTEVRVGPVIGREHLGVPPLDHEDHEGCDALLAGLGQLPHVACAAKGGGVGEEGEPALFYQGAALHLDQGLALGPSQVEVEARSPPRPFRGDLRITLHAGDPPRRQRLGDDRVGYPGVNGHQGVRGRRGNQVVGGAPVGGTCLQEQDLRTGEQELTHPARVGHVDQLLAAIEVYGGGEPVLAPHEPGLDKPSRVPHGPGIGWPF